MPSLDLDLLPALRRALDDDLFVVHFQPEVDLASGAVVGMEALLRWQHGDRGLLWPRDFLDLAETAGLMPRLGQWMLDYCARELQRWRPLPATVDGAKRQLWVNASTAQLLDPGFVTQVADTVHRYRLAPGVLGIEVTEAALAEVGAAAPALLAALVEVGVAVAVDDFGSWHSSLATLGELPIDAVKLHPSFVRGVGSDLEGETIVASVIELAHAYGLRVVAEGVESWSEGARLCELGCDRALGFLFSGPQRPEQARLMMAHGTGWRGAVRVPAPRERRTLHAR